MAVTSSWLRSWNDSELRLSSLGVTMLASETESVLLPLLHLLVVLVEAWIGVLDNESILH